MTCEEELKWYKEHCVSVIDERVVNDRGEIDITFAPAIADAVRCLRARAEMAERLLEEMRNGTGISK